MLLELIYSSILWIDAFFPPKGGGSSTLSPRNIMANIQFDYNKHFKLQFGSYVQAHQEPSPTNTQAACAVGAICLGPTGNIQGSYKFLDLTTGKRITWRRWTPLLPMPQEVIEQVNQFRSKQTKSLAQVALRQLIPEPSILVRLATSKVPTKFLT